MSYNNGNSISIEGLINEFRGMSEAQIKREALMAKEEMFSIFRMISFAAGANPIEASETFAKYTMMLAKIACDADGKLVPKEKELLKVVLGDFLAENSFFSSGRLDESAINSVKSLLSSSSDVFVDFGVAISRFMMCFIAIDGDISSSEVSEIRRIFTNTYERLGMRNAFRFEWVYVTHMRFVVNLIRNKGNLGGNTYEDQNRFCNKLKQQQFCGWY